MNASKMKQMTARESSTLSMIRVGAMMSIVVCHLFQAYGKYEFSSVFNVGVQVFFVLSGYLYGAKTITSWMDFAKRRVMKLYMPYALLLAIMSPLVIYDFGLMKYGWYLLNLQGLCGISSRLHAFSIPPLAHCWFLTAIFVSYATLPFLQQIRIHAPLAIGVTISSLVVSFILLPTRYVWGVEWVVLFAIGYLYRAIKESYSATSCVVFEVLCCVACVAAILCMDRSCLYSNYDLRNRIFHVTLGVMIFIASRHYLPPPALSKLLSILDRSSFMIYLVHFPFFIGKYSLAHLTPYNIVNVVIMIVATIIATFVLAAVSNLLSKFRRISINTTSTL